MLKKMMLLAMSVGALVAFAAPAVAQANVQLTDNNGQRLASNQGVGITATSTNLVTTLEGGGQLECEHVTLHLELLTNGLNHVTLKQLGEATTTNCNLNVGALFTAEITDGTLGFGEGNEITIDTWGEGTTNALFGADVPELGINCTQEGSVDVLATDGTDVLDVEPSLLTGTGCGNGTIHGEFTLETSGTNGAPVFIDAVNT
jgi:hypothetical protein